MNELHQQQHDHKWLSVFIPEAFFYLTIALSLCFMIVMAAQGVRDISFQRSSFIDNLTFWIDALGLQAIFVAVVSLVIGLFIYRQSTNLILRREKTRGDPRSKVRTLLTNTAIRVAISIAVGFFVVILLMVAEFALEEKVFKPSFAVPRPGLALPDPPFTRWVEGLFGISRADVHDLTGGAPSGYVLRQWWLFLLFVVVVEQLLQELHDDRARVWIRAIAYVISFFTVLFIGFSRVYRGHHSIFDVGISFGLGTFFFWLVAILPDALVRKETKYLTEIGGAAFAYLFLFFFYSQSSYRWVIGVLLTFTFLAITYLLASRRQSYRSRYREWRKVARKE